MSTCSIDNCCRSIYRRDLCRPHWLRLRKYGNPIGGKAVRGDPARFILETAVPYLGDECLMWPFAKDGNGYGQISDRFLPVKNKTKGSMLGVHRVVCELAHGKPPSPADEAAHLCGKGHLGCCNPVHLSWKTRIENISDRRVHDTEPRGERNGASKLSSDDVVSIRAMSQKYNNTKIASMFGVKRQAIGKILSRERWGWME